MKPIFLLISSFLFSLSLHALEGAWQGTYKDPKKTASFTLIVEANGSATYYDDSSVGPYCKGQVASTKRFVSLNFTCDKKVSGGIFTATKELRLEIYSEPNELMQNLGLMEVEVKSNAMGRNTMLIQKVPEISYGSLHLRPTVFDATIALYQYDQFRGNMQVQLHKSSSLEVASGELRFPRNYYVFGRKEEIREDGLPYYLSRFGSYKFDENFLVFEVRDDNEKRLELALDLSSIDKENVYLFNDGNLPKSVELKRIPAKINGQDIEVEIYPPALF
tara:strand:- start:7757 stop:8584 length:828 start_codon:yes stop_codon:yes gene_type:complete